MEPDKRKVESIILAGFLLLGILVFNSKGIMAQFVVGPYKTAEQIVKVDFLSGNVRTKNHRYSGMPYALGVFASDVIVMPIQRGIVLSTGNASHAAAPNTSGCTGQSLGLEGDIQLSRIANNVTYDAAILEFDFLPPTDSICFNFFFGSEEYPEFVGKGVNDVFAFFLTETDSAITKNLALLPDGSTPVTVDEINAQKNAAFYIENKSWNLGNYDYFAANLDAAELSENMEFDGITSKLIAASKVKPYHWYHIKIAIADAGDPQYDSAVFLEAKSFRSPGKVPGNGFELDLKSRVAEYPNLRLERRENNWIISSNVEFEPDSFNITPGFRNYLLDLVAVLNHYPGKKIHLAGHTDNTGNKAHNLELSEKRAKAIASFLVAKNISKLRLKTTGYGETKPLLPNTSDVNKMRNRRVEFEFVDAF